MSDHFPGGIPLTATELECFRLVQHTGPLTAADLARETGLTPASLSVIVEKLVDRKFLSRTQDLGDRRRWLLQTTKSAIKKVDAVYAAHARRVEDLLDAYTDDEFQVVLQFMNSLSEELKATAIELTKNGQEPTARSRHRSAGARNGEATDA